MKWDLSVVYAKHANPRGSGTWPQKNIENRYSEIESEVISGSRYFYIVCMISRVKLTMKRSHLYTDCRYGTENIYIRSY